MKIFKYQLLLSMGLTVIRLCCDKNSKEGQIQLASALLPGIILNMYNQFLQYYHGFLGLECEECLYFQLLLLVVLLSSIDRILSFVDINTIRFPLYNKPSIAIFMPFDRDGLKPHSRKYRYNSFPIVQQSLNCNIYAL